MREWRCDSTIMLNGNAVRCAMVRHHEGACMYRIRWQYRPWWPPYRLLIPRCKETKDA